MSFLQDGMMADDFANAPLAELGETVTYVAADDSQTEMTVVVGTETAQVVDLPDGRFNRREKVVDVSAGMVPAPETRGRFIIGNEAWGVEAIAGRLAAVISLRVVRLDPIERTHGGYRIGRR